MMTAPTGFCALLIFTLAYGSGTALLLDDLTQLCARQRGMAVLPDVTDPTSYVVCCPGPGKGVEAFSMKCTAPEDGPSRPFWEYGPGARTAVFNAETAKCINATDVAARSSSSRQPGIRRETAAFCENAAPARARYMGKQRAKAQQSNLSAQESSSSRGNGRVRMTRHLVQAGCDGLPAQLGQFQLLINPDLGRSSSGVVATHAVLIPGTSRVVIWTRQQPDGSSTCPALVPYEPNMGGQVSAVYDAATGTYLRAETRTSPFCSGHSHISDGTIVVPGGEMPASAYPDCKAPADLLEGRRTIRHFSPTTQQFTTIAAQLASDHWYPTTTTLPDDRVIITGGYFSLFGPPNPAVEVYNAKTQQMVASYLGGIPFTNDVAWFNLYPAQFLLPWTSPAAPDDYFVFMFACDRGEIYSVNPASQFAQVAVLPPLPMPNICSAFSSAGAAVLLPLKPQNNYAAEVVMFGGTSRKDPGYCPCSMPALDKSFRIRLGNFADVSSNAYQWEMETMPMKRTMSDAVLLPNGKVIIVNGAEYGTGGGGVGGGGMARTPAYQALLYDPDAPAGNRYTPLASSTIKRLYHSSAMLLPSGDVLIMGSEQEECVDWCWMYSGPGHQLQTELFKPPYAFSANRPTPHSAVLAAPPAQYALGAAVTVQYYGTVTAASLLAPGARTHSTDMSQRLIFLTITANTAPNCPNPPAAPCTPGALTLQLPAAASRVTNPGYYMLWLLNGDVPAAQAMWVRLIA